MSQNQVVQFFKQTEQICPQFFGGNFFVTNAGITNLLTACSIWERITDPSLFNLPSCFVSFASYTILQLRLYLHKVSPFPGIRSDRNCSIVTSHLISKQSGRKPLRRWTSSAKQKVRGKRVVSHRHRKYLTATLTTTEL